jgi:hypothetical protein
MSRFKTRITQSFLIPGGREKVYVLATSSASSSLRDPAD